MASAPRLVLIGGPNGAGKSTLTKHLQGQGVDFGEYINPDDIAATVKGDRAASIARSIADARCTDCLRRRESFTFETALSHPGRFETLRTARALSFEVTLFFISMGDPLINISRVKARVEAGGHDVPADVVVSRYKRTMSHLYSAVRTADRSLVFDNSGENSDPKADRDETGLRPSVEARSDGTLVEIVRTRNTVQDWIRIGLIEPVEADRALLAAGSIR